MVAMRKFLRRWVYELGMYADETDRPLWRCGVLAWRDTRDYFAPRSSQPLPQYAELVHATLKARTPQLVAGLMQNNALLRHLQENR